MRFGVLGPLAVWTDGGAAVTIPGAKVRALLANLIVHEGWPVSTDRLVEDLWGDAAPSNAPGALQVRVSQLRKALENAQPGGRELVESRPPGYRLSVDADAVDAWRFTRLAAEAQSATDPRQRAALLADALGLWRGPAFADFGDDEFARTTIARLDEQRLAVLEQHAEARLELGEHALLAGELTELVAQHPLRERLRAAAIRALYGAGRPSEALDSYADLRTRLADELGLDPGPELVALHRAILEQSLGPAPSTVDRAPRTNLPAPLTELIGRDEAVPDVRSGLGEGRLVTLVGPGGVGKTRLAVEAARGLVERYDDGVWLIELTGLDRTATESAIADLITAALEIRDVDGERLVAALSPRRLLLVLDNCEHVVEAAAAVAGRLLAGVPGLRILATSREPLGLPGEALWDVPPLAVPPPDVGDVDRFPAVRLFVARAVAASRGFTLDAETGPAVARLCRRLDGLPLALELAATRVRSLGLRGVVDRLDDRFRLLASGPRGAPARQRTLTAVIDWSWELLTEPERVVLRRLSVPVDGCTVDAAEAVCAAADVVDILTRLVDRSLVVLDPAHDEPRYRLLESVAAYGLDRVREVGELAEVRRRHAHYYADLVERAEPELYGHDQRRWLRRLDAEAGNIRAALDAAAPDEALRIANAMTWYWFLRGRLAEARRVLGSMPVGGGDPAARARVWHAAVSRMQGGPRVARTVCDAIDDPGLRARAQWFLAFAVLDQGDIAACEELLDDALAGFRGLDDQWGMAAALSTRAKLAHIHGDLVALERDAERSAALFGELGDRWGLLQATEWLGGLADMTGDHTRAAALNRDGLRLAEELGLWLEASGRLGWLGWIALQVGDLDEALAHAERGLRMAVEQDFLPSQALCEMVIGFAARRQGRLDDAERHLRHLVDLADAATEPLYLAMVWSELGYVAELRGDAAGALALHLDAFGLSHRLGGPRDVAGALEGLASALAASAERMIVAAQLLGAAAAARESTGLPMSPAERPDIERATATARAALGDEAFAAEHDRGTRLKPETARALLDP